MMNEHDASLAKHAQLAVGHLNVSWDLDGLRAACAEADKDPQVAPVRLEDVPDFASRMTDLLLADPGTFKTRIQARLEMYLSFYLRNADGR